MLRILLFRYSKALKQGLVFVGNKKLTPMLFSLWTIDHFYVFQKESSDFFFILFNSKKFGRSKYESFHATYY